MVESWYFAVIAMYVVGFILAVAGITVGLIGTIGAVTRAWLDLVDIEVSRHAQISTEILDHYVAGQDGASNTPRDVRDLNLYLRVNQLIAEGSGRDRVRGIGSAILYANRPTGAGVFLGALLTTTASIMALYPPN